MIYLDTKGRLRFDNSPSIQEQNSTVFTPEVRRNFLMAAGKSSGFGEPVDCNLLFSYTSSCK